MRALALIVGVVAACGGRGGTEDAAVTDAAPDASYDANPALLSLHDVAPAVIEEGQGDGHSAPALIVVRGDQIVAGAAVAIAPTSGAVMIDVGAPIVSADNRFLAVPVTAHVDTTLGSAGAVLIPLDITISQPDGSGGTATEVLSGALSLQALPELTHLTVASHGVYSYADTAQLAPLYSQIDLSAQPLVSIGGTPRGLFRAVSSVRTAGLNNDGSEATGATPGGVTAGGCPGGPPQQPGACAGGGGAATTAGNGGGGAGFAIVGYAGLGSAPGAGGPAVGDPLIATYDGWGTHTPNVSSGGGGCIGAGGGGGGPTIELSAGGDVISDQITARGGQAGSAINGCAAGGGAGGIVVVRSASGLAGVGGVSALGGAGNGGTETAPGHGAPGRVRWDSPLTATGPGTDVGGAHRGPSFVAISSHVERTSTPTIDLVGTAGDSFDVYVVDQDGLIHDGSNGTFGAGGTITITPDLIAGRDRLCVTVDGGQRGTFEADTCVDLAYLP